MNTLNDTVVKKIVVGNPIPDIIDQYLISTPVFTLIADASDLVYQPSDLDFQTILSNNELWVLNMGDATSYGSTVTIYNAGQSGQVNLWRQDPNANHFMDLPTAIAFSDNTNFATSSAVLDAHHAAGHFAGPTLWSSDSLIYALPGQGPLGSHIDMLHQSPYSMGIAAAHENSFWVYDGYNQRIVWYDFVDDHGPGWDDHTDGLVRRYDDIVVSRLNDSIPNHLVLDNNGMLYVVDNGNARVIKMDTHTGSVTGSFNPYAEYITEHSIVTGVTWWNFITTGVVQPAGIDAINNRLIVSDYSNGDIIIYNDSLTSATELGRIHTGAPGITGVKIGPDGKIWYTNALENKVYRIDGIVNNVNQQGNISPSVYPTPADKFLYVTVPAGKFYSLSLLNTDGQVVWNGDSNAAGINTSRLAPGVYIVKGESSYDAFSQKVIIRH
jgi:hypothetical protein